MRRFVTIAFVPAAAIVSSVAVYHNRKYFRTFNIFRARHKTIEMYPLAEETVQMSFDGKKRLIWAHPFIT